MLLKGVPMLRPLVLLATACAASLPAAAGTASSQFAIQVTVAPARERCSGETVNQPSAAVVQVICDSGNFVNIAPGPGTIVGPQSTFFRYYIENVSSFRGGPAGLAGTFLPTDLEAAELQQSVGTVTGLRVVAEAGADNRYELLISF